MRWYARVSNGDVMALTLDELDDAYENGAIDAGTLILAPDATDWVQLGELAGLRESDPGPVPIRDFGDLLPLPPPRSSRPRWIAPVAFSAVVVAAFVAAGFEAQQAGAFSRRSPHAEDDSSRPPRVSSADVVAPSASALGAQTPPASQETERRPKQNRARTSPAKVTSSERGGVFTSGGDARDPLNADLP
jgi:hypothetical protein